ncbi:C40 family peptidase [uncultured Imperialibacter sp.]|uniref:C40 family peptidase n=1 Tax=uncultured Imperialibacter sp. TaxID=1672639 RepID=UPI0030D6D314
MSKLRPSFVLFIFSILILSGCAGAKKSRAKKVDVIIQSARSYTGTPYKYGGTTRSGIDCSGLILRSFESASIQVPRTSNAQSKMGRKVSLNDLEEGDLIFFAMGKKKRKITHVGMVTDVRGKTDIRFIHASTKLGVMETNLKSDYYWKRIVQARRPF